MVGAAALAASAPGAARRASPSRSPPAAASERPDASSSRPGLAKYAGGKPLTWFADQCTAAVTGRLNPSTDTPHCDITARPGAEGGAQRQRHGPFKVTTGIIGDGYCGTAGHATCVIGVGTAQGLGTVVRITFKAPAASASTTTTTATTTPADDPSPRRSGVVQPLQVVVADDPPQPDADRLLQEVGHRRPARDRRGLGRRGRRRERRGSEAMAMERSSWKGSVVTSTTRALCAASCFCASAMFS